LFFQSRQLATIKDYGKMQHGVGSFHIIIVLFFPLLFLPVLSFYSLSRGSGCWNKQATTKVSLANRNDEYLLSSPSSNKDKDSKNVFVCTNVWCAERGSLATLSAFVGLATEKGINVDGVSCLGKCKKGPNVRCQIDKDSWIDFSEIDSVEQARQIMIEYMGVDVCSDVAKCLDLNLQGNYHLSKNEVSKAIHFYNKALAVGVGSNQEGVVTLMRATAHLQRALGHRTQMEKSSRQVKGPATLPDSLRELYFKELVQHPALLGASVQRISSIYEAQENVFETFNYKLSMYDHSLYQACQDAIRATELLPNFPQCWIRAAEVYTELRMFKRAQDHYNVALSLCNSLSEDLGPILERLAKEDNNIVDLQ